MITMLLGGLWHGAAWTTVIWGGLLGLALVVQREWQHWTEPWKQARPWMGWLGWALTMYWFCLALMVFRALNLPDAFVAVRSFVLFQSEGAQDLGVWMLWIVVALGIVHWMNARETFATWWRRGPDPVFAAAYGCAAAVVLLFIPAHYTPFIYFQF
jgi:D-alanyl-lipoteichoic acid acyltransferase DltB (MBOAT superfamily)